MSDAVLPPDANRVRRFALIAGIASLALCVVLAFFNHDQFFRSYLFAYVFWISVPLGSLAILMLHNLTGGAWGQVIRPLLQAATRTLPLMVVLFVPIVLGMHSLYEWTHEEALAHDPVLRYKSAYLNTPFFLVRAVAYFVIWLGLAALQARLGRDYEASGDPRAHYRLQMVSGPGLVLYAVAVSFAAFDWMMSVNPHWQSTMFGLLYMTGQGLTAFTFIIGTLVILSRVRGLQRTVTTEHLGDLGNLTLAFVMLWAYMSISQFLIIWSANIPEEIRWYLPRMDKGWGAVALLIVLLHFALPFVLLLSRKTKRTPRMLLAIVSLLFVMRLVDLFWVMMPAFHAKGFRLHLMDLLAPVAIGGLWLAFFVWQLGRRPLVAPYNPGAPAMPAHEVAP